MIRRMKIDTIKIIKYIFKLESYVAICDIWYLCRVYDKSRHTYSFTFFHRFQIQ